MNAMRLQLALPRAPRDWLTATAEVLAGSEIDTPEEQASFVAQLAHESAEFTRLEEGLNYSAQRLMAVWPRRFPTLEAAQPYARNPAGLANHVYANRLGNGPESSGDGWLFRGRGPLQITGRRNYTRCGVAIGEPLPAHPELLLVPRVGVRAALWFWRDNDIDAKDDDDDAADETRTVNGGQHGLADRQAYRDRIYSALTA